MQPSVFLSRKTYRKYGPFRGSKHVMEYDLWLKIGKKQMPKVLGSYLSSFRITKGTISTTSYKKVLREDEVIAAKYTDNPVLLVLHYLHNLGRVIALMMSGQNENT